jgi:tetratricopeptide (TPR) repeat protein
MNDETDKINWINITETLIPLLIITVLGWIAWLFWHNRKSICTWIKRMKLKFFPVNFNIAFSLDFKEGLNSGNYFEQILKNINSIINKSGLYKQIIIKDFSNIQKFRNKEEAELFNIKKGIDLIIWGGFTNDILKVDGENINEIELHFSYGHPDNKEKTIGKMILLDISSKLAKKSYWKIVESNSLKDTTIISNNIFDISTYIIALTLKIYGQLGKSLLLFEQLYNNLVERKDNFQKDVLPHLHNLYEVLIIEYGINRNNYNLGSDLCSKILNIKENDFFALSNLATFQCKLGNKEGAEKLVELLLKLYPKIPTTEVDVAYFRIIQKNYTSAFKHYKNLMNFNTINFEPQYVIEFLCDEYDKLKEPALLFGVGILSYKFGDKKLAKDNLHLFLQKANETEYKLMYREAKRIIKKL